MLFSQMALQKAESMQDNTVLDMKIQGLRNYRNFFSSLENVLDATVALTCLQLGVQRQHIKVIFNSLGISKVKGLIL